MIVVVVCGQARQILRQLTNIISFHQTDAIHTKNANTMNSKSEWLRWMNYGRPRRRTKQLDVILARSTVAVYTPAVDRYRMFTVVQLDSSCLM